MERKKLLEILASLIGSSDRILERIKSGSADLKSILPQVKGVNLLFALGFKAQEYWASPKADGIRTIILGVDKDNVYSLGSEEEKLNFAPFSFVEYPFAVDTELLETGTYLAFDVLGFGGESWMEKTYSERLQKLSDMNARGDVRTKKIVHASKLHDLMRENPGYEVDGVILTNNQTGEAFKWKPEHQLTIDFLVKNDTLYVNDGGASKFIPKFKTEDDAQKHGFDLQDEIAECCWKSEWKLVRVRKDREAEVKTGTYFGNHRFVADKIWFEIHYPVPLSWLEGGSPPYPKKGRFDDRVKFEGFEKHECVLVVSGIYLSRNPGLWKLKSIYVLSPDPYDAIAHLEKSRNLKAVAIAGTPGARLLIEEAKKNNATLYVHEKTATQLQDMDLYYS